MGQIRPDFSEAKSNEREPIQPGDYAARILGCEEKTGKQSGKPYLSWKLELQGEGIQGRWVFHTTPIQGKGAGLLKQMLLAADPSYDGGAFNPEDYIGRFVAVTVEANYNSDGTLSPWPKVMEVRECDRGDLEEAPF